MEDGRRDRRFENRHCINLAWNDIYNIRFHNFAYRLQKDCKMKCQLCLFALFAFTAQLAFAEKDEVCGFKYDYAKVL